MPEPINMFIPIQKVNAARREVWGFAAIEEPDNSDEILDYESSKPHFLDWSNKAQKRSGGKSFGNVRSMHQNIAAGILLELRPDDVSKGFYVGAKIIDDGEWKKVESGVYTGFSVGGSYIKRWSDFRNPGKMRYTAKPTELSIVDSPCIPSATFEMVKADGISKTVHFKPTNGENMIEVVRDSRLVKVVRAGELTKWEEQKHPRAKDGEFTSKGSGAAGGGKTIDNTSHEELRTESMQRQKDIKTLSDVRGKMRGEQDKFQAGQSKAPAKQPAHDPAEDGTFGQGGWTGNIDSNGKEEPIPPRAENRIGGKELDEQGGTPAKSKDDDWASDDETLKEGEDQYSGLPKRPKPESRFFDPVRQGKAPAEQPTAKEKEQRVKELNFQIEQMGRQRDNPEFSYARDEMVGGIERRTKELKELQGGAAEGKAPAEQPASSSDQARADTASDKYGQNLAREHDRAVERRMKIAERLFQSGRNWHKITKGDVMNKLERIYEVLDGLEEELQKADIPDSPEPIADIPLKGEYGSVTVEQMPAPSVLLEIEPNSEPSQEVLATHAVKSEDLTKAFDAWLPKVGVLVKSIVAEAVAEAMDDLEKSSAPARKIRVVNK